MYDHVQKVDQNTVKYFSTKVSKVKCVYWPCYLGIFFSELPKAFCMLSIRVLVMTPAKILFETRKQVCKFAHQALKKTI